MYTFRLFCYFKSCSLLKKLSKDRSGSLVKRVLSSFDQDPTSNPDHFCFQGLFQHCQDPAQDFVTNEDFSGFNRDFVQDPKRNKQKDLVKILSRFAFRISSRY